MFCIIAVLRTVMLTITAIILFCKVTSEINGIVNYIKLLFIVCSFVHMFSIFPEMLNLILVFWKIFHIIMCANNGEQDRNR